MNQLTNAFPYRLGQFFRALTARVSDKEMERAACILTPASLALFHSMAIQDQCHGFDVCTTLQQVGYTNSDLLTAALLHDVGKAAARLPTWQRAIIVLLNRFAPRLLARLSRGELQGQTLSLPNGWRRPFVVHVHHPEIGAQWAAEAGCSPIAVALIRRHQDKLADSLSLAQDENEEENQLLGALQAADSTN
jgi:hypothetical protein